MFNLIKNEFIKVFHKKSILFISLIVIAFSALQVVMDKISIVDYSPSYWTNVTEETLSMIDTSSDSGKEEYISDASELENINRLNKYSNTWRESVYNNGDAYELYHSYLNAKMYGSKEDEAKALNAYNDYINKLDNNEWDDYIDILISNSQNKIENYNKELDTLKENYDYISKYAKDDELFDIQSNYDNSVKKISSDLEEEKITLECLKLRKDNNISYDKNDVISRYEMNVKQYNSMSHNESDYKSKSDLEEFENVRKEYLLSKYKIDHKIFKDENDSLSYVLSEGLSSISLFVLLLVVIVSGSIVADEYNKGTIKQLLLRPYTRGQILLSKYIVSLLVFIGFVIFVQIVNLVTYNLIGAEWSTLNDPVLFYNYNSNSVVGYNVFVGSLINFLSILPFWLIIHSIAFGISTIIKNGTIAFAGAFGTFFIGDLISAFTQGVNKKIIAFLPSNCWNLNPLLFGGSNDIKGSSFGLSLSVDIVLIVVIVLITFIVFKKDNIKNQ